MDVGARDAGDARWSPRIVTIGDWFRWADAIGMVRGPGRLGRLLVGAVAGVDTGISRGRAHKIGAPEEDGHAKQSAQASGVGGVDLKRVTF